ncbi:MAG TPA: tetratricopeptide repeat protein [Pyrinomonadaceae bacterium]|nr:tetratricopeptide repeat protein [Pyrinomonadaceae bacterium]
MTRNRSLSPRKSGKHLSILLMTTLWFIPAKGFTCFQDPQSERQRAFELFEKSNFAESIPLLEKLPEDPAVLSRLGFALYATAVTAKDDSVRRKQRDRARQVLLRSQQLGDDSNLTRMTLESLSSDTGPEIPFSAIKEAEAAIRAGEEAFVRGELDKALEAYERALSLDPKLYDAALYAGDMYFKKGYGATDPKTKNEWLEKAGDWFARAIQIDQNRETAHRYWGDALMLQKKSAEARNKFVDAIVAEPYSQRAYVGLTQWAERVRAGLSHPELKQPPPTPRSSQDKDRTTITVDPKTLDPNQGPAYYWSFYDLVRSTYRTAGFAKDHPNETEYRHSLKEEASALTVVAETAFKDLNDGKLKDDPSLNNLINLWRANLIEAYVLFARANEGIAQDYAAYRKVNREKLVKYWLDFVIERSK